MEGKPIRFGSVHPKDPGGELTQGLLGVTTRTSQSLPTLVRTQVSRSVRPSHPEEANTARSMSLPSVASPRAIDPKTITDAEASPDRD